MGQLTNGVLAFCMAAEKEGFEPPVQLPVHLISSQAHSTTLAFFHFLHKRLIINNLCN